MANRLRLTMEDHGQPFEIGHGRSWPTVLRHTVEKIIYHVRGSATKPPVLEILAGKGPNNLYFVSEPFRPTDLRVAMGGDGVYALKNGLRPAVF